MSEKGTPANRLPRILFRADGGRDIATGHLMRCLSIAACLRSFQAYTAFALRDEEGRQLLQKLLPPQKEAHPNAVHVLSPSDAGAESELSALFALFRKEPFDFVLVDLYTADNAYLTVLRRGLFEITGAGAVGYFDDLRAFFPAGIDLVINYDPFVEKNRYDRVDIRLLGPVFAPLRPQFFQGEYQVRPHPAHLLITTGGTDPLCLTEALSLRLLRQEALSSLCLHVVIGASFDEALKERLAALSKAHPRLLLHENVGDFALLMRSCDLAVSAAGNTLYELCAVGLPAVSFAMTEEQAHFAKQFAAAGFIPCAGSIRTRDDTLDEDTLAEIERLLLALSADRARREEHSFRMRCLTDGKGAVRIANAILSACQMPRR